MANGYTREEWAAYQLEYYHKNKDRINARRKDIRKKSPESDRDYKLRSNYQITSEDYDRMLEDQEGVCGICRQPCSTGNRLVVDHDHSCCPGRLSCGGCVRGLLCKSCNNGIGHLKDDVLRLQSAIHYLQRGAV